MSFTSITLTKNGIITASGHKEDSLLVVDSFRRYATKKEDLSERLQEILEYDIDKKNHICICEEGYYETKLVAMPDMSIEEAQKVIDFDKERYLPWHDIVSPPIVDVVKRSPSVLSKEKNMMDAYIVGIPKEKALFMARSIFISRHPLDIITYYPAEQVRCFKEWKHTVLIHLKKESVELFYWNENILEEHVCIENSPTDAAEYIEKWYAQAVEGTNDGLKGVAISWDREIPKEERPSYPNYEDWLAIEDEFGKNPIIPIIDIAPALYNHIDMQCIQDQVALGGLIRGLLAI